MWDAHKKREAAGEIAAQKVMVKDLDLKGRNRGEEKDRKEAFSG